MNRRDDMIVSAVITVVCVTMFLLIVLAALDFARSSC